MGVFSEIWSLQMSSQCPNYLKSLAASVSLLLRMHRFVHQQRSSQVSPTLFCNSLLQASVCLQALFFSDTLQHGLDLLYARRRDSDKQTSTPYRRNNVARAVCEENETEVRAVLLHGTTEGGLGIACEMVGLIDHDDLEALLGGEIDLLCLRNFFEEILDNDAIVVAHV
jgi:hypothetical protein